MTVQLGRMSRVGLILLLVMGLIGGLAGPQTAVLAASPLPNRVLVNAADTATLHELRAGGGVFVADYGAFSLWRVSDLQRATLSQRSSITARDDFNTIMLRDGAINTASAPAAVPSNLRQQRVAGPQLWLVQFVGPLKDDWLANVRKAGATPVIYMPNNAYLVWADDAALTQIDTWATDATFVQWSGAYHPAYRLAPSLLTQRPADELVAVTVQFYTTAATDRSLATLLNDSAAVVRSPSQVLNFTNVTVQLPAGKLIELANRADVYNVEPWVAPRMLDEVQNQIIAGNITTSGGNVVPSGPNYLAWLASKGFPTTPASYPVVDVVDDGIDIGNAASVQHPDFHELGVAASPDRVAYISNCTTDTNGNGVAGHGNLNAGIVAGYNNTTGAPSEDGNGYQRGLGVSPYGRVAGTKIFRNAGNYDVSQCGNSDAGVVEASYAAGATFTSNSWGADVGGAYDSSSQAYDALTRDASTATAGVQPMLHIFAAGNDGPGSNTIGSPGTAKNVLTVGATENVRDDGVLDGCNYAGANNADDIAMFSSRGPTDDNRTKPDIMAPGTHVQGPASQDPGFNGAGVCGAAGNVGSQQPQDFYPLGQTLYTWSSGTSHSTPAVAGAASLAYEYYGRVLNVGQTPSPAMLKAMLLNSTRYLDGSGTGGTLPTQNQGWGDIDLGRLFDSTPKLFDDQATVLGSTGQDFFRIGSIASSSQPVRVTLVWNDAPGSTTGASYVNDLNLEVSVGGTTYLGNVFSGATSTSGGTADSVNNVESVFLPAGTSGALTVRVVGANIAGDGVPGNADTTDQDFALMVYNVAVVPGGSLTGQITDATTGDPIAGATVTINELGSTATTDASGTYTFDTVPPGTYTLSVSSYGYTSVTIPNVVVTSSATTTQNASLTTAPATVVSGTVSDGSGHGWPLYAHIDIAGYPDSPIFTDPVTGAYSVTLVQGQAFNFTVTAVVPGYNPATRTVTPSGTTQTENFALLADTATCAAPGYVQNYTGTFSESFDSGTLPAGWSIVDNDGSGQVWEFDDPGGVGNLTGGDDGFAIIDSDNYGQDGTQDTELRTPVIDLSGTTSAMLEFDYDYRDLGGDNEVADVDVSIDGGTTWTNVWTRSGTSDRGPQHASIDISALADGEADVVVRFHYYDASWSWWWEIDNVTIGTLSCDPVPGGLVVGHVYDANTGEGINGATVSSTSVTTDTTTTFATPADPNQDDGLYVLFSSQVGAQSFTASYPAYGSDTRTVTVVADDTVERDFFLGAAQLTVTPEGVVVTLVQSTTTTRAITITNTGTVSAPFELFEVNAPIPVLLPVPFTTHERHVDPSALNNLTASEVQGYNPPSATLLAGGEVLSSFNLTSPITHGWGLGYNTTADDMWIGNMGTSGGDDLDYRFLPDGTNTGDTIDTSPWIGAWAADMTYNPFTNKLWQVNVGGDNCIYELDPVAQVATGNRICPAFGTSERGLAFDPLTNTYYAGSWNDSVINHFSPDGTILDSKDVRIAIAGLAFNPATGHLFVANSYDPTAGGYDIYMLDTNNNYAVVGAFLIDGPAFDAPGAAAGLSMDCDGHLWAVDQNEQTVYEIDSGEAGACEYNDIPWLTTAPTSGTIPINSQLQIDLTFDSTGLAPGTYQGHLRIVENTPYEVEPISVTLNVVTQVAALDLTPATAAMSGRAGTVVSYPLTLTNTGNATDSFALTVNGNDWTTTVTPLLVGPLAPGASATITVQVAVPANANAGDTDTITVVATSQQHSGVVASAVIKTTAMEEVATIFRIYLPLVLR